MKDQVVVITGATGGLGKVVTKTVLNEGARVVSTYRTEGKQTELGDYVGEAKNMLDGFQADVTDASSVKNFFQKVFDKYGRVDILLNLVGAYRGGTSVADTKESDWDFLMKINLKSAFLCSSAVLPTMIKQNYGRIVSVAARTAVDKHFRSNSGAYSVSKAGVVTLTETMAEEVKKYNINVNCVIPSTIDTLDNRVSFPKADFSKWVKPEEIAKVILFLVSENSNVTSGAAVPVYGKA